MIHINKRQELVAAVELDFKSGMTLKDACKKNGTNHTTFYSWKKNVRGLKRTETIAINLGDFTDFCTCQVERKKASISLESYHTYKSNISKLIRFQSQITFSDLTEDFFDKYRAWMLTNGNNENTVSKSMSILRTFSNLAVRYGMIEKNPFQWYRIKKINGKRDFLSKEEFDKLFEAYNNNKFSGQKKTVLRSFLISCTTGLRFGDMRRNFDSSKIKDGMISMVMHKTGLPVTIPINKKASDLIFGSEWPKTPCNKVLNRNLKLIASELGFEKKVTYHVARHTFATISISLGMPIEVVSKLLGHTDIKTTQIYAKVVDSVKIKEMAKWDI